MYIITKSDYSVFVAPLASWPLQHAAFSPAPACATHISFCSGVQPTESQYLAHSSLVMLMHLLMSHFGFIAPMLHSLCIISPSQCDLAAAVPPIPRMYGAMTRDTIDINLIRMFIDGPDVSLNGSPTVSPVTDALCGSDFL